MDAETTGREPDNGSTCQVSALRPGDSLGAWENGMLCHTGVVEEVAPELGVVWIRERGLGAGKMLSADQHCLRPDKPVTAGEPFTTPGW